MTAPRIHALPLLIASVFALLVPSTGALAQTSFFQIFNGRVNSSETVNVRNNDRVVVRFDGQTAQTTVDSAGEFQGLTITRSVNNETDLRFEFQRGNARYALVSSPGSTEQLVLQFSGSNNPLSAALNAQTLTLFIGQRLDSGGDGDGDGETPDGDPADVNRDGVIDVKDAQMVMRHIIGLRGQVSDPAVLDVNGDGRINTDDVVIILRRHGEKVEVPSGGGETET